MTDIKHRIDFLQSFKFQLVPKQVAVELYALQLRKIVELVIFSSLIINRKRYTEAHKGFDKHWRIAQIIKNIKRQNSNYLPIPIKESYRGDQRYWDYPTGSQFFSESDLITIYEDSSVILHTRNPFADIVYNIDGYLHKVHRWIGQIVMTLNCHKILPPDSDEFYMIHMLEDGKQAPTIYGFKTIKYGDIGTPKS